MSRFVRSAAPVALALVLLSACGSDSGESSATVENTPSAEASMSAEPFCSEIDTTLVAAALGIPAADVELTEEQKVGDEVETGKKEGQTVATEANSCTFGTSTERFLVTVQPESSADDLTKLIKEFDARAENGGKLEACTVSEDAAYGDPNAIVACEAMRGPSRVTVVALGLLGSSKFYCSALLSDSTLKAVEEPTLTACAAVRDQLTNA